MAAIFQGKCSACGYQSPAISDSYLAVIVDDPLSIAESTVHPENNRILILAHPNERHILEENGYTLDSAVHSGRLLSVNQFFCTSCGLIVEQRRLSSDWAIGCLAPLLIGAVAGIAIGYNKASIGVGFLGGLATMLGTILITNSLFGLYLRLRYPDRIREFETPRVCSHCGSYDVTREGLAHCPNCQRVSMRITMVGKS
jgi:hypothetical protein